MTDLLPRVRTTAAAQTLIEALRRQHGDILFYQSHGCCAGSAPNEDSSARALSVP